MLGEDSGAKVEAVARIIGPARGREFGEGVLAVPCDEPAWERVAARGVDDHASDISCNKSGQLNHRGSFNAFGVAAQESAHHPRAAIRQIAQDDQEAARRYKNGFLLILKYARINGWSLSMIQRRAK